MDYTAIDRTANAYYTARNTFNSTKHSYERAVLFYYLNRNCFNGIYRVNKNGEFNVPFSDKKVPPYLTQDQFCQSANLLSRCKLFNDDFEVFIDRNVTKKSFVFLDPPYYVEGIRIFNEYTVKSFGPNDFDRLEKTLDVINTIGAKFLLSLPASECSNKMTKKWYNKSIPVRRSIAGSHSCRVICSETLIANYRLCTNI